MEERKIHRSDKVVAAFFYVFLVVLLGYLIFTQSFLPRDKTSDLSRSEEFNTGWTLYYNDEINSITLPIDFDFDAGETITIVNQLPEDMADYNGMLVWSEGMSLKVYLDDELIYTYDASSLSKIGKDNPYWYIWVDLPLDCAGKEIKLEQTAYYSFDAGTLGEVSIGEKLSLFRHTMFPYLPELVLAVLITLMGFISMIAGLILWHTTKHEEPLAFSGAAVGLSAIWTLANSDGRQFVVNNVSSIRNVAFLVVPLLPIAFLLFMDISQAGRYHKVYHVIQGASVIDFIVVFLLHIFNIRGLSTIFTGSLLLCLVTVVVGIVTIILDLRKDKLIDYKWSAIGLGIFGITAVIQIVLYVQDPTTSSVFLLLGLFGLICFSVTNAVKNIQTLQSEKIQALIKVKTVSIEAMEAIAKAVDAKDTYTAEHSERVAAYSVALAKALGGTPAMLHNIRYAALLHDIGKIGIPDAVLNKPGKLTDEEYAIIKSHTTIGGDIMKKVTSFPNADTIARYHHERYDGKGYPEGLKGEHIPKEARIACIADAYDAMNSRRVYRKELTKEKIREELVKGRGSQFDPHYLDVFLELFDSGKLDEIEKHILDEKEDLE